jgi:hypothetical protein
MKSAADAITELFRFYDARLHSLPEAPMLRVANHKQRIEHGRRLQALNADKIVPRFGTDADPDPECDFFNSCTPCWSGRIFGNSAILSGHGLMSGQFGCRRSIGI